MDLGEIVQSLCSETVKNYCAEGSADSDVRCEEVSQTQEEEYRLAVSLTAIRAADKLVVYVTLQCLTVVQACVVATAFWQCVVWCLSVTLQ
jgi:hypothetical protein